MNEHQIKLFSSKKSDNWGTPKEVYDPLHEEFNFDFDPCPMKSTFDGLKCDWGKRNFINPPYSNVKGFLLKAFEELVSGRAEVCVFLTFANTETAWFHEFIYPFAELRFIKGRIRFIDENGNKQNSAMRPSMIAILRRPYGGSK